MFSKAFTVFWGVIDMVLANQYVGEPAVPIIKVSTLKMEAAFSSEI
jgi:hypothetical protein